MVGGWLAQREVLCIKIELSRLGYLELTFLVSLKRHEEPDPTDESAS
jgi:hypothetical protein